MNSLRLQPKALPYLFLTEMWERYGFYVVQGLLVLYMSKVFGFSDSKCYSLQGLYTALVFTSPIIGGVIADKWLGYRFAIITGGVFLSIGYALLALPFSSVFYFALGTIIVGNGLFKPNVSSLLGTLYETGDPTRESGFTIFYIGINVGGLLAGISSGLAKEYIGWHASFSLACLGLLLGVGIFCLGIKRRLICNSSSSYLLIKKPYVKTLVLLLCPMAAYIISQLLQNINFANYFFPALGTGLLGLMLYFIYQENGIQRKNLFILCILILSSVLYWTFFLQLFFSITFFIERLVQRNWFNMTLPTTFFYTLESIFVIALGPIFAWSWNTLSINNKNPTAFSKFIVAIGFACLAFLTLFVSTYFANSEHLIHPYWIILAYFFITFGEMLLSPIGLSAVTTLAPRRLIGMMMGIWFVATGFGGQFAGLLAKTASLSHAELSASEEMIIYRHAFCKIGFMAGGTALILYGIYSLLNKRCHT